MNVPDNEKRDFEIEIKANSNDFDKISNLGKIITGEMNHLWGSFIKISVLSDDSVSIRTLPLIESIEFYPTDVLRKGIQMSNEQKGKSEFVRAVRHMLWTYLNEHENEIYRKISRSDMFRNAEGNLLNLAEINA